MTAKPLCCLSELHGFASLTSGAKDEIKHLPRQHSFSMNPCQSETLKPDAPDAASSVCQCVSSWTPGVKATLSSYYSKLFKVHLQTHFCYAVKWS